MTINCSPPTPTYIPGALCQKNRIKWPKSSLKTTNHIETILFLTHIKAGWKMQEKTEKMDFSMKRRHLFISAMIACTLSISIVFGNPAITQISPHYGSASGGESITITGTGFTGATEIKFGPTSAPIISISDTQITTTAPRSVPGTVHISVTVGADSSPVTPSDRYTYQGSWFA